MATDSASCEPDLSRAPGDTEGATAEAAVIEFPGGRERCRCGLGGGARVPTGHSPRGAQSFPGKPCLPLGCPLTSPWSPFPRVFLPSPGYPLSPVPLPLDTHSFPGVCPSCVPSPGCPQGQKRVQVGERHPTSRVLGPVGPSGHSTRVPGDPFAHSRGALGGSQSPLFTSRGTERTRVSGCLTPLGDLG